MEFQFGFNPDMMPGMAPPAEPERRTTPADEVRAARRERMGQSAVSGRETAEQNEATGERDIDAIFGEIDLARGNISVFRKNDTERRRAESYGKSIFGKWNSWFAGATETNARTGANEGQSVGKEAGKRTLKTAIKTAITWTMGGLAVKAAVGLGLVAATTAGAPIIGAGIAGAAIARGIIEVVRLWSGKERKGRKEIEAANEAVYKEIEKLAGEIVVDSDSLTMENLADPNFRPEADPKLQAKIFRVLDLMHDDTKRRVVVEEKNDPDNLGSGKKIVTYRVLGVNETPESGARVINVAEAEKEQRDREKNGERLSDWAAFIGNISGGLIGKALHGAGAAAKAGTEVALKAKMELANGTAVHAADFDLDGTKHLLALGKDSSGKIIENILYYLKDPATHAGNLHDKLLSSPHDLIDILGKHWHTTGGTAKDFLAAISNGAANADTISQWGVIAGMGAGNLFQDLSNEAWNSFREDHYIKENTEHYSAHRSWVKHALPKPPTPPAGGGAPAAPANPELPLIPSINVTLVPPEPRSPESETKESKRLNPKGTFDFNKDGGKYHIDNSDYALRLSDDGATSILTIFDKNGQPKFGQMKFELKNEDVEKFFNQDKGERAEKTSKEDKSAEINEDLKEKLEKSDMSEEDFLKKMGELFVGKVVEITLDSAGNRVISIGPVGSEESKKIKWTGVRGKSEAICTNANTPSGHTHEVKISDFEPKDDKVLVNFELQKKELGKGFGGFEHAGFLKSDMPDTDIESGIFAEANKDAKDRPEIILIDLKGNKWKVTDRVKDGKLSIQNVQSNGTNGKSETKTIDEIKKYYIEWFKKEKGASGRDEERKKGKSDNATRLETEEPKIGEIVRILNDEFGGKDNVFIKKQGSSIAVGDPAITLATAIALEEPFSSDNSNPITTGQNRYSGVGFAVREGKLLVNYRTDRSLKMTSPENGAKYHFVGFIKKDNTDDSFGILSDCLDSLADNTGKIPENRKNAVVLRDGTNKLWGITDREGDKFTLTSYGESVPASATATASEIKDSFVDWYVSRELEKELDVPPEDFLEEFGAPKGDLKNDYDGFMEAVRAYADAEEKDKAGCPVVTRTGEKEDVDPQYSLYSFRNGVLVSTKFDPEKLEPTGDFRSADETIMSLKDDENFKWYLGKERNPYDIANSSEFEEEERKRQADEAEKQRIEAEKLAAFEEVFEVGGTITPVDGIDGFKTAIRSGRRVAMVFNNNAGLKVYRNFNGINAGNYWMTDFDPREKKELDPAAAFSRSEITVDENIFTVPGAKWYIEKGSGGPTPPKDDESARETTSGPKTEGKIETPLTADDFGEGKRFQPEGIVRELGENPTDEEEEAWEKFIAAISNNDGRRVIVRSGSGKFHYRMGFVKATDDTEESFIASEFDLSDPGKKWPDYYGPDVTRAILREGLTWYLETEQAAGTEGIKLSEAEIEAKVDAVKIGDNLPIGSDMMVEADGISVSLVGLECHIDDIKDGKYFYKITGNPQRLAEVEAQLAGVRFKKGFLVWNTSRAGIKQIIGNEPRVLIPLVMTAEEIAEDDIAKEIEAKFTGRFKVGGTKTVGDPASESQMNEAIIQFKAEGKPFVVRSTKDNKPSFAAIVDYDGENYFYQNFDPRETTFVKTNNPGKWSKESIDKIEITWYAEEDNSGGVPAEPPPAHGEDEDQKVELIPIEKLKRDIPGFEFQSRVDYGISEVLDALVEEGEVVATEKSKSIICTDGTEFWLIKPVNGKLHQVKLDQNFQETDDQKVLTLDDRPFDNVVGWYSEKMADDEVERQVEGIIKGDAIRPGYHVRADLGGGESVPFVPCLNLRITNINHNLEHPEEIDSYDSEVVIINSYSEEDEYQEGYNKLFGEMYPASLIRLTRDELKKVIAGDEIMLGKDNFVAVTPAPTEPPVPPTPSTGTPEQEQLRENKAKAERILADYEKVEDINLPKLKELIAARTDDTVYSPKVMVADETWNITDIYTLLRDSYSCYAHGSSELIRKSGEEVLAMAVNGVYLEKNDIASQNRSEAIRRGKESLSKPVTWRPVDQFLSDPKYVEEYGDIEEMTSPAVDDDSVKDQMEFDVKYKDGRTEKRTFRFDTISANFQPNSKVVSQEVGVWRKSVEAKRAAVESAPTLAEPPAVEESDLAKLTEEVEAEDAEKQKPLEGEIEKGTIIRIPAKLLSDVTSNFYPGEKYAEVMFERSEPIADDPDRVQVVYDIPPGLKIEGEEIREKLRTFTVRKDELQKYIIPETNGPTSE